MNADERRLNESELNSITEKIIGSAYNVGKIMGCGFLEKVYENALAHELRRNGFEVKQQYSIPVYYDDAMVGDYVADLLVNENVLVEIKAVRNLDDVHMAQCLNYLKGTGKRVCLLINFGNPRVEVRRIVNNL